ncbi:MAG TPA: L-fucose mutarotase [bacterium]|jgi:L-fucose mutarotase|nr:L-fucose mutarotase [Dictyoglomota bacterium]HHV80801.1 L-fucose mutarotase [bacterium]HON71960.1 L-fucose mutarotase [bacterium]HPC77406.1 L-fucose mutarotase [bacterium]HRR91401.1 L-fucose mutarotase [bacterium]
MLKGISPLISPELLKILCEMGHGDEILLADANYPAESCGPKVVRADGIDIPSLLKGIMDLFPLDTYVNENVILMSPNEGKPSIWEKYEEILKASGEDVRIGTLSRFDFYERASKAYAVVATGERALYANIILKKGVIGL